MDNKRINNETESKNEINALDDLIDSEWEGSKMQNENVDKDKIREIIINKNNKNKN